MAFNNNQKNTIVNYNNKLSYDIKKIIVTKSLKLSNSLFYLHISLLFNYEKTKNWKTVKFCLNNLFKRMILIKYSIQLFGS